MAQVVDIEIIANCLFKSLFNCINYSENNILKEINIQNKYKKDIEKIISNKISNYVDIIINGQQDMNEDIIYCIDKKINSLKDYFINLFDSFKNHLPKSPSKLNKKGRNSILTENKKYCNYERSQNRGKCKIMIKKNESTCYAHKHLINSNNIINDLNHLPIYKKNKTLNKFRFISNKIILNIKIKRFLENKYLKDEFNNLETKCANESCLDYVEGEKNIL